MVEEAVQLAHGFFDLDLRAGEQVDRFGQGGGLGMEGGQTVEAGGEGAEHVASIALAAEVDHLAAGGQQAFGVGQVLVFLFELLQLVLAEGQVLQFVQLVAEQLVAGALLVAGAGEAFQLLAGLPPALCRELDLAGEFAGTGEFVQQATMGVCLEQGLVLVLAVDIDQQLAQGLEVALGAGAAIYIGARPAFGGDDAAQDAGPVVVQVALGQPGASFGDVADVEAGENVGLVGAGAHHAAVGAIAQGEAEGVEHDRLAGSGFAGDHGHSTLELQVQVLDDGVVMDRKVYQHGATPALRWLGIYTVFVFWLTIAPPP
ncbi:hypothetical protein D9M69_446680 [compost metagenome]